MRHDDGSGLIAQRRPVRGEGATRSRAHPGHPIGMFRQQTTRAGLRCWRCTPHRWHSRAPVTPAA
ncbi:hypothetical protein GR255_08940 [Mycobacterium tuberculosis]|nr:hypothetical protein [Mycobacterium tuberculosis]